MLLNFIGKEFFTKGLSVSPVHYRIRFSNAMSFYSVRTISINISSVMQTQMTCGMYSMK